MDLLREGATLDKENVGEVFDFAVRAFDDAYAPADTPATPARADEAGTSQPSETKEPAMPGAAPARAEPSFSRDLIDTYFRQMGDGALLSREQEIALAKRIEAAPV